MIINPTVWFATIEKVKSKGCECCGTYTERMFCAECMAIWYDCGLVVKSEIAAYRNHALANGYWPFDTYKHMPESEYKSIVKRGCV